MQRRKRIHKRKIQGGLEQLKAEQDRLIFIFSTRNEYIQSLITDYDITVRAGIDSS